MWNSVFRTVVGAMLLMPVSALAAPEIQLPMTGQTTCWDSAGIAIDCRGTGQDGDTPDGVAWPAQRFIGNGDGTVTDTLTDLVWLQNADCYGATGWQQALDNAKLVGNDVCGLSDGSIPGEWRLPNRNEMLSIISYQSNDGAAWLNSQGFTGGVHGWYWTSDTYAPEPANKWVVHTVGDALSNASPEVSPDSHALYVRDLAGPMAELAPLSDDFGDVGVGRQSAPRNYTISNTGAQNLVVSGITPAGTDGAMFTVDPGDGTEGTCGPAPTIAAGGSCSVSVVFTPASTGPKTAELAVASNSVGPAGTIALAGNGIIVTYEVSAVALTGENGTVEPAEPLQVASGSTAEFTLAPAAGFQPDQVVGGTCPAGTFSGNTYTTGAITENCTVSFDFLPLSFSISTATSGNGTITCTPGTTVAATTEVSCTATPAIGQQLSEVTVDGAAQVIATPTSFTHSFGPVIADHAISATFAPAELTVSFAAGNNGSIAGNATQSIIYDGSTTEVTAVPATGYHFVNWTSDGGFSSTANPLTIANVTANQAITANFAADVVTVDLLADLVKAYRYSLGKEQLSEEERGRCDVAPLGADGRPDPNGVVDVGDVVIMLRRLAGLVTW